MLKFELEEGLKTGAFRFNLIVAADLSVEESALTITGVSFLIKDGTKAAALRLSFFS